MPFRKPEGLAMVSSLEDDEADDEDHYPIPASAQDAKKNRGEPAESPDSLSGMAAMQLRDSYEEDGGPGGKRGRGPLKRQESFEVTENLFTGSLAFKSEDVRLKQDGMRDGSGQQVSTLIYSDLDSVRELGRGATSRVWLKRHRPTGEHVACKELSAMLSDDHRRMAVNELRIAHKHARQQYLVNFIDAFFVDGRICIAMEYCAGGSLEGVIKTARPLGGVPEAALGPITLQYLRGLQYLHREMRQVHRDLKPANIMLTASGLCKISDFGISKQLEETRSVAMTQVGTTMYMAPERFRGDTYSYPSDVWAVGVITLEALTGHHPFEGIKQFLSLQAAICEQPSPRAPVGAPAGLIEFVAGCLRKDSAVGKDGRPDVRQLVSGAWLRPHSLGDPAYMTMCYLQSVGLLTPSNGYTTAPTTAPSDPSAAAAAGAASPPPTLPLAPVAPASMDDDDL